MSSERKEELREDESRFLISEAEVSDAERILTLQKRAYSSEAEIYRDYEIEPLVQTMAHIRSQFDDHLFLKSELGGDIVGSVRARLSDGTCHIGKLIVHPDYQNRGIGKRLMAEIEACFEAAGRFELFTGHKSDKNLRLYEKLGYRQFGVKPIHDQLSLVFMEKRADA